MALESIQPLTEMSTRNLLGGLKGGRRVRETTSLQSMSRIFRDIGFSDFIHRPGIKKQTKEKHDVSETGSVSVLR
jgi:hypothetical protein